MYYTINKVRIDKNKSADPTKYRRRKGVIGKELVGFLEAHLDDKDWQLGASTEFGPHSFLYIMI